LGNTGSQTAPHHLDDDAIAMLLDRSKILLDSGDLASARLLLERAAEAGSANAALKLGETFDPKFLQSLGTLGVVPDVAMARQWYEKAAALGSESAAQRIAELTAH
jgi:TPR repeat protein